MKTVKVKAYAKVNLSLNITGTSNGYHTLDSVVTSIDIFDVIILQSRKDKLVNVYMKGLGFESLPPEKNNAYKAACLFTEAFETSGADITVYKNIPEGAGLGGSSADAAGVLNGLKKLYGIKDDIKIKEIADSLGSDTGYMLCGGFARLSGRGEIIEKISTDLKLSMLMLLPDKGVSTADCFKLYDKNPDSIKGNSEKCFNALVNNDIYELSKNMYNALSVAAVELNAEIETAFLQLKEFSPLGIVMSGSGSAVYALFENGQFTKWAKSRYKGKLKCIEINSVNPDKIYKIKNPFVISRED